MTAWTFHPRYVSPFHDEFIGDRLARATPARREALQAALRACAAELDAPTLQTMLAAGWRASTMATWFIAARRERGLQAEVERGLVERPGYAGPACVCLAHLGGDSAREALSRYVADCTEGGLQGRPCDEARAPEWAVCAWAHLARAAPERRWADFVEAEMRGLDDAGWFAGRAGFEGRLRETWSDRFASARAALPTWMDFLHAAMPA